MKIPLLTVPLLLAAACASRQPQGDPIGGRTPEIGVIESFYQVVDERTRTCVGYVEKTSYDSGRIIYWVYGPDRAMKMGYVLANNSAFRYVRDDAGAAPRIEPLGADVMAFNVRRILDYNKVVELEAVDPEAVARASLAGRYGKGTTEAAADSAEG